MDIIKLARDLGAELQKDDTYTAHAVAKAAADNDEKLQEMIGSFNLKKIALGQEIQSSTKDEAKVAALNTEVKELYAAIMQYPAMLAYNTTKGEMDKMLNFIQQIIVYAANGEDPYAVEEDAGCSGSCSSCSGCH